MENKKQVINYLQQTLSGIVAGTQQHFIHATINKHNGYHKLAERMLQEYNEEIEGARKFIERIIELGAEPNIEPEKWPVQMDIENQLRVEYQEQEMALEALNGIISGIQNDEVTKQLFKDYLLDETHHTEWLKQQLNLIESTGLKNYLASQI